MRERHNIVGSEVGTPRPPVYMRKGHTKRRAQRGSLLPWLIVAILALTCAFLAIGASIQSSV